MAQERVFFRFGEYAAPWHSAVGTVSEFGKARGLIAFCVVPFVKALGGDVPAVLTAYKAAFTVVTPRSCEKNGVVGNGVLTGEAAVVENKAHILFRGMSGRGGIAVTPYIIYRADLAVFKQRVAAAENEIHISRDKAVFEDLTAVSVLTKSVL